MNALNQLTDIYNWKFSRTQNETGQRSKEEGEWIGIQPINPELISDAAKDLARMEAERARYRLDLARAIALIEFSEADKFAGTTLFKTWQEVQAALKSS